MAIIALTSSDVIDYISDKDPAKKPIKKLIDENDPSKGEIIEHENDLVNATIFKVKSIDTFLMGYIYDNASVLRGQEGSTEIGIQTRVNQTNIEAVRHGLVGFENFRDDKNRMQKFETEETVVNGRKYIVAADATIRLLGIQLIAELAMKIKKISEVQAEEAKN